MENILTDITNYLLIQSWHVAVLALVIAAVSLLVRNKSAHARYLLWLIVLAKCLVPPLVTIPLAILPQQEQAEPVSIAPVETSAVTVEAVEISLDEPFTSSIPVMKPAAPSVTERLAKVTVREWLALGWIIGVALFVLVAVIKVLRLNRWLRRERRPLPAELQGRIEDLSSDLSVRAFPEVWLIDGIGQPFVWGLLRGSIYLPANFARTDNRESRRGVLGHELSHVLRFDAFANLLQIIAQGIFWFHPFVWWANKKIRAEREKCCDEMVIARLNATAKDYSAAIVNTLIAEHASTRPVPSLAVVGPVKNIEDRIKTIMNPRKKFYRRPSVIVVVIVLLLAALVVPTTLALTTRKADPQPHIVENSDIKVLDIRFEPIRQGKNVVRIKVQNSSDQEQTFATHIYTRSPDYGRHGVGWGTPFFDTIKAKETKWSRLVFRIQGPVTDNTWLRLKFYNPDSPETYDYEKYFQEQKYISGDLEQLAADSRPPVPASKKDSKAVIETFHKIQGYIKDKKYEQAWELFTRDYQNAEFQTSGLERFKKAMEPAHILDSAFLWERDDFVNLKPRSVTMKNNLLTLTATYKNQSWETSFAQEDSQWKIDWIAGYTPRILLWQNWQERLLPRMEKHSTKHFDIYYFKDSTAEEEINKIAEQRGASVVCR